LIEKAIFDIVLFICKFLTSQFSTHVKIRVRLLATELRFADSKRARREQFVIMCLYVSRDQIFFYICRYISQLGFCKCRARRAPNNKECLDCVSTCRTLITIITCTMGYSAVILKNINMADYRNFFITKKLNVTHYLSYSYSIYEPAK
jgi:hypothetical protein